MHMPSSCLPSALSLFSPTLIGLYDVPILLGAECGVLGILVTFGQEASKFSLKNYKPIASGKGSIWDRANTITCSVKINSADHNHTTWLSHKLLQDLLFILNLQKYFIRIGKSKIMVHV